MRSTNHAWILLVLICLVGCKYEASFKTMELQGAPQADVFDTCKTVVTKHYNGIRIRVDPETGHIETGPVEFTTENGLRQQRVFVKVSPVAELVSRIELMALIYEPTLHPTAENPYQWAALGSDHRQEQRLMEEIIGEVKRRHPRAEARSIDD